MSSPNSKEGTKTVNKASVQPTKNKRDTNNNTAFWRKKKMEYDIKKFSKHPQFFSLPPYIYGYKLNEKLKIKECSKLKPTRTQKAAKCEKETSTTNEPPRKPSPTPADMLVGKNTSQSPPPHTHAPKASSKRLLCTESYDLQQSQPKGSKPSNTPSLKGTTAKFNIKTMTSKPIQKLPSTDAVITGPNCSSTSPVKEGINTDSKNTNKAATFTNPDGALSREGKTIIINPKKFNQAKRGRTKASFDKTMNMPAKKTKVRTFAMNIQKQPKPMKIKIEKVSRTRNTNRAPAVKPVTNFPHYSIVSANGHVVDPLSFPKMINAPTLYGVTLNSGHFDDPNLDPTHDDATCVKFVMCGERKWSDTTNLNVHITTLDNHFLTFIEGPPEPLTTDLEVVGEHRKWFMEGKIGDKNAWLVIPYQDACEDCGSPWCIYRARKVDLDKIVHSYLPANEEENKKKRFDCYAKATRMLCNGRKIGWKNRIRLGWCFENKVQNTFPSEEYTGFRPITEDDPCTSTSGDDSVIDLSN